MDMSAEQTAAFGAQAGPSGEPKGSSGLGDKVIRNIKFLFLRALLTVPLSIVVVPLVLRQIGPELYGTWAILVALAAFTQLSDFGLGGTISKHVAYLRASNASKELSEVLSAALALYLGLAITLLLVLNIVSTSLLAFFVRGGNLAAVKNAFLIMTFGAALNVLTIGSSSVLSGLQRLDLASIFRAVASLLEAVLTIALVKAGLGLMGITSATAFAALVNLACQLAAIHKLLPEARYHPRAIRFGVLSELTSFSAQVFLTQIATLVHTQLDKLLLGRFIGTAVVAVYDISADFSNKVRAVPQLLLAPVIAAAADLDARQNLQSLWELYARAHKYLAALGAPILLFTLAVAPQFVSLWVGRRYDVVARGIVVLLTAHYINLTTGPGYLIQVGRGRLRPGFYSAAAGVFLNGLLSLVCIPRWGFGGALLATGTAVTLVSMLFHIWFQQDCPFRIWPVLRSAYAKPLLLAMILGVGVGAANRFLAASWSVLVLESVLYFCAYAFCIARWRFFQHNELVEFQRHFPLLRMARRMIRVAE